MEDLELDRITIRKHGGPASFARLLGMNKPGSTQTVSNWLTRGIPPAVKLKHPHVFGIRIKKAA